MKSKKEPAITAVINRLDAIGDEVANIKKAMATKDDLNKVVDRITGHIDGLWGESRRLESVALMQSQRLKDEHEQLNDHERRIVLLEKKITI